MILGKVIFAVFGLHLCRFIGYNPIAGLVIGALGGHVLDIVVSLKFSRFRAERVYRKHAKAAFNQHFLSSLFHMLGTVCGCDGAVTKDEIAAVDKIIKETLKLSKQDRKAAVQHFRGARNSNTTFQSSAVKYFELYQDHPAMLEGTLQMFMNVASADGKLNDEELRMIKTAATVFGLDERKFSQMERTYLDLNGHVSDIEKSYAVLGCKHETPDLEIKKRYRKLVATYHPDKIASKDLPEEFMQFANQKMKDIQAAYEAVKAERGFN
jgi:DnaJ like chaperone protein